MKKKVWVLCLSLLLCLLLPLPASANSAEPPLFTILVIGPTGDLSLSLEFSSQGQEEPLEVRGDQLAWETYYRFERYQFPSLWEEAPVDLEIALQVDQGGESFRIPLDPDTDFSYNSLFTLDLSAKTLSSGQPFWRPPLLVGLRVLLTLLLEGLVFFLAGYREKRSWLIFLLVNLVTQLGVNLLIFSWSRPLASAYSMGLIGLFFYCPMELIVLLAEVAVFCSCLKEKTKGRAAACAILANLFSWALGGWLLTALPI